VKIESVDFFARHLVIAEREAGLTYLRVIDKARRASHRVTTPEPVYTIAPWQNKVYDTDSLRFGYTSMVTPTSTYTYHMGTRRRRLVKRVPVVGYDPAQYQSERVWITVRDGTRVPVALVYRKGTKRDGTAPLLLYAYGSYGISIDPGFSSARVSLLDRGVIWALASIRGGGELGEPWREQGRMMKKMNTFTDFIDVAEGLIRERYTARDRLAIEGGSAGGLLVGAVVNMRPELVRAAIAHVPFVDVLNTMLDASLPLTTSEYTEWGNPNEKAAFDYMRQYSPYDNITAQAYPNLLVRAGYHDSQVPYWEAAKFTAKLRALKTDRNELLLTTNMGAGHGGSSGRFDRLREIALDQAFVLKHIAPAVLQVTP
jgi:oligopeptidase B